MRRRKKVFLQINMSLSPSFKFSTRISQQKLENTYRNGRKAEPGCAPDHGCKVSFHVPSHPLSASVRLPVNDELVWDNGTPFPEPCIDRIADTVGKNEDLAWMCGGLSFFASLGLLAVWNDKASKIPFAPEVYPYHNLRVELGEEP